MDQSQVGIVLVVGAGALAAIVGLATYIISHRNKPKPGR